MHGFRARLLPTAKGEWVSLVAWPGFVGRDGAVPDWYPQAVADMKDLALLEWMDPANQVVMVEAVRGATVLTATEADVNDYEYYPVFRDLYHRRCGLPRPGLRLRVVKS